MASKQPRQPPALDIKVRPGWTISRGVVNRMALEAAAQKRWVHDLVEEVLASFLKAKELAEDGKPRPKRPEV